ncbi:MFS transporter [Ekhidna sp.]
MHKNVWTLTIAQAFIMSVNSLNVFAGGLIGNKIAPSEKLATLPVASIIVGTALATVPLTMMMKNLGRRKTFLMVAAYSLIIALLASYAIYISHFYLFSLCTFLLGVTSACIMQFRFASMESVAEDQIPKAASYVLLGGIAAAYIGPEVALLGKDILATEFAGSFLLLGGLFVMGFLILLRYENTISQEEKAIAKPRKMSVIASQKTFWVAILGATIGYAVMAFIMTATPVSMHVMDGHSLNITKTVIQSHIVAMFLPSLITGHLINRFGVSVVMILGLIAYLICVGFAFAGHFVHNYWVALILLGIGWNFLFVAGTTLLPQTHTSGERFKVQAFNEFFLFSSQAVASLSAGWVVFEFGWEVLLLVTLPFILIQFITLAIWKSNKIMIPSKAED